MHQDVIFNLNSDAVHTIIYGLHVPLYYRNLANKFNVLLLHHVWQKAHENIIIKLNSDAVHQHVRHTCSPILHKPCTFLWIWYSENRRTRIHSYVHLWYASPKRVPTSTNHQNAYRSQKRLPASGKLTSTKTLTNLKSAYLLTTSPVATENSNTQFGNYFLVDFLVFEVNLNLLSVMILYGIDVSINFNFFVDPIQYFKVFSIRFFVHNVSNYRENLFIIRLLSTYMSFF